MQSHKYSERERTDAFCKAYILECIALMPKHHFFKDKSEIKVSDAMIQAGLNIIVENIGLILAESGPEGLWERIAVDIFVAMSKAAKS